MDKKNKDTDRDFKPSKGQESNENWDDANQGQENTSDDTNQKASATRMDEDQNTSGYGSSQRGSKENVGPLDADFEQLPSEKRRDRGSNLTGPGLG